MKPRHQIYRKCRKDGWWKVAIQTRDYVCSHVGFYIVKGLRNVDDDTVCDMMERADARGYRLYSA